jgi:replicative DNA helicase
MQLASTYDTALLRQYACGIYDKHIRRKFFEVSRYLERNSYYEDSDIADVAEQANKMLADLFRDVQTGIITLSEAINRAHKQIEENSKGEKTVTGTPTGFSKIDRKTGGLQAGDLIIIAGDTSQGKTSFALSICKNAARCGEKIAFFSLEMTSVQLAARVMAMESGIPVSDILYRPFDAYRWEKLDGSVSRIYDLPIYIDERATSSIDRIISSIRHFVFKYGIKGAVVDYLQILSINMKGVNKEQQLGDVSRRLKNLAKDLNIWIIALSQLNRNGNSHVPSRDRIRDSGQIVEASDILWLVYRPEHYDRNGSYPEPLHNERIYGTAMIDLAKGRNAGTGRFLVGFDAPTTHFYELDEGQMLKKEKEDEPF